jgi:hypothetical protein
MPSKRQSDATRQFLIKLSFRRKPMTTKLSLFICAGLLAGCVTETLNPTPTSNTAKPRLVGEATAVAVLTPALAQKGLQMQPMPASRAGALAQYCTGNAEAIALTSDMNEAEVTKCYAAGGRWSAVSSEGMSVYLSRAFNAQNSGFDWWG